MSLNSTVRFAKASAAVEAAYKALQDAHAEVRGILPCDGHRPLVEDVRDVCERANRLCNQLFRVADDEMRELDQRLR